MQPLHVLVIVRDIVYFSRHIRAPCAYDYGLMTEFPSTLQSASPLLHPAGNLIYKGGGGEDLLIKTPPTIPELYLRTVASDPNSTFDQASFEPQVLSSPSHIYLCLSLCMP